MPSSNALRRDGSSHVTDLAAKMPEIKCAQYQHQILQLPSPIVEEISQQTTLEFSQEKVRIHLDKHDPIELVESFGSAHPNTYLSYAGPYGLLELDGSQGDTYSDLGFEWGARERLTI
jgi:hypothetical protein